MFGPKSKALLQFEHYLETRSPYVARRSRVKEFATATLISVAASLYLLVDHGNPEVMAPMVMLSGFFAFKLFQAQKLPKPPINDEVWERADMVAARLRECATHRRLHLVLHPGVAAVLNESAGFWRRIHSASDERHWSTATVEPHWLAARRDWLVAADLAMAESLLLAEEGMTLRPGRGKAKDAIGDAVESFIDTYVFQGSRTSSDPLPPSFSQLRDLAERLKLLATEVEGVSRRAVNEPVADDVSAGDAAAKLTDVLSHLRSIQDAEAELRQDLQGR